MFLGVGTENEYLGWKMKSTLCIGNQTSEIQILFTGFGIENESLGRKMKVLGQKMKSTSVNAYMVKLEKFSLIREIEISNTRSLS